MLVAVVWLLLALIIGMSAFFIGGVIAALVGGDGVRDRVGRWYISMGQAAFENTALVVRKTGGLELTTVSFAPKFGGDASTIGGVKGHWRDPLSVKSTLSGKEFGIALESSSCYISPLAAEFGEEGSRRLEDGWLGSSEAPEDGREQVTLDYSVCEEPQILDLRAATQFIKGSCKRRWGALGNKWAELSQEKFHDRFSVGQSLLWMGAFALGVSLAFLIMKYGTSGGGGGTTVPIMFGGLFAVSVRSRLRWLVAVLTSTRAKLLYLALIALGFGAALVVVAAVIWGVWSAIAVGVGLAIGGSLPYIYVRVMFSPLGGGMFGSAFFILGQLTFGAGALVRRDDGAYEWCRLREDDAGLFARLESGRRVPIAGTRDDCRKVAWAPLAVVEEKTERNMQQYTVDESEFQTTRPDPAGQSGDMIETPIALADGGAGWHLDASKLERWARGSGGSELPREGRRKALEEKGGAQQISQLVTMLGAGVLMILGFVLGAGVLML